MELPVRMLVTMVAYTSVTRTLARGPAQPADDRLYARPRHRGARPVCQKKTVMTSRRDVARASIDELANRDNVTPESAIADACGERHTASAREQKRARPLDVPCGTARCGDQTRLPLVWRYRWSGESRTSKTAARAFARVRPHEENPRAARCARLGGERLRRSRPDAISAPRGAGDYRAVRRREHCCIAGAARAVRIRVSG